MPLEASIHEGASQESLLHRFQRMVQMSGVLRGVKANSHFVSKGDAARIKAKTALEEAAVRGIKQNRE